MAWFVSKNHSAWIHRVKFTNSKAWNTTEHKLLGSSLSYYAFVHCYTKYLSRCKHAVYFTESGQAKEDYFYSCRREGRNTEVQHYIDMNSVLMQQY